MNENGRIKNRLVVLRAEKGWTQQDVAKRLGVSRQTIVSLEAGRYSPSLKLACEIAHLFGVKLDDVFQYVDGEGESLL